MFSREKKYISKKAKFKKYKRRFLILFFLSFFLISFLYIIKQIDEKVMPPVVATAELTAKNKINNAINNSLIAKENVSEDFYKILEDDSGMVNFVSVDTVKVNKLCSSLAVEISNELEHIGDIYIPIPLGSISGVKALANLGPKYPVSIYPVGDALVDYKTSFTSVGINQVNFQIWLSIESTVKIINPFIEHDYMVSRKIAVVDTVFSGKVPETYLNNVPLSGSINK